MISGGKGQTFFHEKKSRTSAPVFPSPNPLSPFKKSGVFLLQLVATPLVARRVAHARFACKTKANKKKCDTVGEKCVYWHAESLESPVGNAVPFTARKRASRRETAVPAFSPPDSPLFQFPVARNVCWYFPSITAPAFSRLHRLHSRLTARLPSPALNFFSASAGC